MILILFILLYRFRNLVKYCKETQPNLSNINIESQLELYKVI